MAKDNKWDLHIAEQKTEREIENSKVDADNNDLAKPEKKKETANNEYKNVYQFNITLNYITPRIWRRIQVPDNYTFRNLHTAIQEAMGWYDSHLHEFRMTYPVDGTKKIIGIPDEENDYTCLPEEKQKISRWFNMNNKVAGYTYDFGDSWEHIIKLEKILPKEKGLKYPICIAGKRNCPPEDCGSVPGYYNLLNVIKNPKHPEYKEMIDWLGGEYDPERFNPEEIFVTPER